MNNNPDNHMNNKPKERKMKFRFQPGKGISPRGSKEVF